MQNCRPPSFLDTNTTPLHHGLWLGLIVPTANISFMCAWTSSTIGGGILQNLSLKGSLSMTLISCFARSVQPNSPGSKEKMPWYSASRAQVAAWFLSDHPSRPDNSSCWKSVSFFHSTGILVPWIPWIQGTRMLVEWWTTPHYPHLAHCICSYYLSNLDALGNGDWSGSQVFHHDCNSPPPGSHLYIGIHDTQAIRQAGLITPFQGLHHLMHVATQKYGLCLGMYDFGWKRLFPVSLSFWQPCSSQLDPWFGLQPFHF